MKIDRDLTIYIAKLAKLKLTEEEIEKFSKDLTEILNYVEKLNSIKDENIEPLYYPIEGFNVFRDDIAERTIDQELALKNAPLAENNYFLVPKTVKNE
jgi:aspartyl-tRNA(Asn)/glutamyl-tRNA(Gln) amidotransferase subunit C